MNQSLASLRFDISFIYLYISLPLGSLHCDGMMTWGKHKVALKCISGSGSELSGSRSQGYNTMKAICHRLNSYGHCGSILGQRRFWPRPRACHFLVLTVKQNWSALLKYTVNSVPHIGGWCQPPLRPVQTVTTLVLIEILWLFLVQLIFNFLVISNKLGIKNRLQSCCCLLIPHRIKD